MSDLLDRLQDMVYVKYDDMNAAREAIHHIKTQAARIAELEAALEKQEAITKDDTKWMMAYHQWCVMNGCAPSSSNLIAAIDALVDTRHMGEKTYWYLKPDGPEAADRIAKLETHLEERKMSSGLVWCICSEADDRIKELKARIAELEAALNDITARLLETFPGLKNLPPIQKATAALAGGKDE